MRHITTLARSIAVLNAPKSSASTTPRLNTSELGIATAVDEWRSGAAYARVPPKVADEPQRTQQPKSASFVWPVRTQQKRLVGFTSLWTQPAAWTASSPAAAPSTQRQRVDCATPESVSVASQWASVGNVTNSICKKSHAPAPWVSDSVAPRVSPSSAAARRGPSRQPGSEVIAVSTRSSLLSLPSEEDSDSSEADALRKRPRASILPNGSPVVAAPSEASHRRFERSEIHSPLASTHAPQ
mmetsp:Transcript_303/g.895  ORF Transcript_303/g.895 Transcript_303/m.895 type:complete len:241 (-) Transcript_303:510-1232(-)